MKEKNNQKNNSGLNNTGLLEIVKGRKMSKITQTPNILFTWQEAHM